MNVVHEDSRRDAEALRKASSYSLLKDVLEGFMKRHASCMRVGSMFRMWPEVVGKYIASISAPYRLREEVLYVHVKDSRWVSDLMYSQQEVVRKYRRLFPKIRLRRIYYKYDHQEHFSIGSDDKEASLGGGSRRHCEGWNLDQIGVRSCLWISWRRKDMEVANQMERLYEVLMKVKEWKKLKGDVYPYGRVATLGSMKEARLMSEMELLYPRHGIQTQFLMARDEFQSFDMYS